MLKGYAGTKDFSEAKLLKIREALPKSVTDNALVVTCGSYARREASAASDMDFFCVENTAALPEDKANRMAEISEVVKKHIGKLPAKDGPFAEDVSRDDLLRNYGGSDDSNETITRRMLYLLEGEHLNREEEFHKIRKDIITRYVGETPGDHQLAFYLLNDMIRYWRTMTVDYANKTYDNLTPKPWAIRNIKLVFSRKIIYASGLFSVALTADRTKEGKIEILDRLFRMTPIDRIKYICGEENSRRLLEMYDFFLNQIADPDVRKHLESLDRDARSTDPIFRTLKNEGHYFSRELMGLYNKTFHASHPIHMAVVF
jgi:predicted nucleotidyltransferase